MTFRRGEVGGELQSAKIGSMVAPPPAAPDQAAVAAT